MSARLAARALVKTVSSLALAAAGALCLAACGPLGLDSQGVSAAGPESSDSLSAAVETPDGGEVALVLDGEKITVDDLHAHMQRQFLEEFLRQPADEIFSMREQAVRDLVQRHAVEAAATERGVTPEALFDEITGAVPTASVQEVTDWYSENQGRLRGARLEDVADRIRELIDNEARQAAWAGFIGPRIDALDWQMQLEPPRIQLAATRLVRGKSDAEVTIMAFSDYQCPYCIRSEPVLAEVLTRYPEDVRVIHRHFPLDSIHPFARPASEAAMCAEEQGKFWEFHDGIFARGGQLTNGSFSEIGGELGLDLAMLDSCIGERRYQAFVQSDFEAGQAAGVTGTPAFFVNGIPLKGARDADDLSRVIDAELARIRAN